MFYYWSNFSDPMASRFSLPLYLVSRSLSWSPARLSAAMAGPGPADRTPCWPS